MPETGVALALYDATDAYREVVRIAGRRMAEKLFAKAGAEKKAGRVVVDEVGLRKIESLLKLFYGEHVARRITALATPYQPRAEGDEEEDSSGERREERKAGDLGESAGEEPAEKRRGVAPGEPSREPQGEELLPESLGLDEASKALSDALTLYRLLRGARITRIAAVELRRGRVVEELLRVLRETGGEKGQYMLVLRGHEATARLLVVNGRIRAALYEKPGETVAGRKALEKAEEMEGHHTVAVMKIGG